MSLAVDILGYAGPVFRVIGKLPGKLRGLELIKAAHAAGKAGGGHKAVISVVLMDVAHTVNGERAAGNGGIAAVHGYIDAALARKVRDIMGIGADAAAAQQQGNEQQRGQPFCGFHLSFLLIFSSFGCSQEAPQEG